jgi:integrase
MPPRTRNRLSALKVKGLTLPGRYADGGGLYLFIGVNGARAWVFRYRDRVTGKHRDKGLGPAADVTLERAREKAAACRVQLTDGVDPIEASRDRRAAERLEYARRMTFGDCARSYIEANSAAWRNAKHRGQWRSTLDTYANTLLSLPVAEIDTALVVKCLEKIWTTKTETATRVRQRIEAVLDWATARNFRTGENPARWRGHLDKLLPKPGKLKAVEHHPALPYADVGAFMADLRKRKGLGASVLELQILTAARPGEVAGAQWAEIDLAAKTWTIPAARMKASREHRIPLSSPAIARLRTLPVAGKYVFPGVKPNTPLSTAAALSLLKELRPGMVPHGFRSSFRDWAADMTAYPRDVAEAALAHALKDKTEAAYRRSDLFEKRARLMADWAKYIETPKTSANVTPIKRAKK